MKTKTKTKLRVKLYNDFTEPYWLSEKNSKDSLARHICMDEYSTYDTDVFNNVLDGFLDAPKKKMTKKDVIEDFGSHQDSHKLSDSRVDAILAYYNGRLDLKKVVDTEVKNAMSKAKPDFPVVLKYNIPFKMNFFSSEDDDPHEKLTTMNNSYIEIEVSKEK